MLSARKDNFWRRATMRARGGTAAAVAELKRELEAGEVQIPQVSPTQPNYAGGTNLCPNADLSYSLMAATVAGTLPGTAGDTNYEAYRFYRQQQGANVTVVAANALKSVTHSLFAANEGADAAIPRWDRVNGWAEIGSVGTQYDLAIQLPGKIVNPGQRVFVRFPAAALDATLLPAGVQAYAGIWHKAGASEGWVEGGAFTLSHTIHGVPGTRSINYRVKALTDSGVSVLSNVLNVPDAPNVLGGSNYVQLSYDAGPGFIEFHIYREEGGVYIHLFTVRNSNDLQYNDTDDVGTHQPAVGWPTATGANPRAYAETNSLRVGAFGAPWLPNDLTINVPPTYNFSLTDADGQFLRIGLTAPTGVDRHIGIDRIWFAPTFNEWSPDVLRLPDGTAPIPSISPVSGNQGGGVGVYEPPPPGGGGGGGYGGRGYSYLDL